MVDTYLLMKLDEVIKIAHYFFGLRLSYIQRHFRLFIMQRE
jgi:hypothetical protein